MDNAIIERILKHTDSGSMYKAVCLVCRDWYQIANRLFPKGRKFTNRLMSLLNKFPDAEWDYFEVSRNHNFRFESANFTPEQRDKWDWELLSENQNLTYEFFKNNRDLPWDMTAIQSCNNIPFSDIVELCKDKYHFYALSFRNDILWEFVADNLSADWALDVLCSKVPPNVLLKYKDWNWYWDIVTFHMKDDFILAHPDLPWDKNTLMEVGSWEFIRRYPDFGWDWEYIARNARGITLEIFEEFSQIQEYPGRFVNNWDIRYDVVDRYPDYNWNWNRIVKKNIPVSMLRKYKEKYSIPIIAQKYTIEDVINNPDINWDYSGIKYRKPTPELFKLLDSIIGKCSKYTLEYITWLGHVSIFDRYPDISWDYKTMSENENITIEFIKKHIDADWDWELLSDTIDCDSIFANSKLPWVWNKIYRNNTLTFDIIRDHPEIDWNFEYLSSR